MEHGTSAETPVYSAGRHWAMVMPPFAVLIFAGLSVQRKGLQAWMLMFLSLAWILFSALGLKKSEFLVTEETLIVRPGFSWLKQYRVPLLGRGQD